SLEATRAELLLRLTDARVELQLLVREHLDGLLALEQRLEVALDITEERRRPEVDRRYVEHGTLRPLRAEVAGIEVDRSRVARRGALGERDDRLPFLAVVDACLRVV